MADGAVLPTVAESDTPAPDDERASPLRHLRRLLRTSRDSPGRGKSHYRIPLRERA